MLEDAESGSEDEEPDREQFNSTPEDQSTKVDPEEPEFNTPADQKVGAPNTDSTAPASGDNILATAAELGMNTESNRRSHQTVRFTHMRR